MKKFLFYTVGRIFGLAILVVTGIGNSIVWVANGINMGLGRVSHALLSLIDKPRLELYSELTDPSSAEQLQRQSLELKLLVSAQQVRDHAKETGEWTEQHSSAINAVADALILESGWEEEHVDTYIKELVESIDGLEYGKEEW